MNCFSQGSMEDVIYLKNGDLIRGEIIFKNDKSIKIRILGGSEFNFQLDEIARITEAPKIADTPKIKGEKIYKVKTKGYYNATLVGLLMGSDTEPYPSIETNNGYYFKHWLAVGLGVQLGSYRQNPFIPVYLDVRGDFLKKTSFSPYYSVQVGKGNVFNKQNTDFYKESGGIYYSYGMGFRVRTTGNGNWIIQAGQQSQSHKIVEFWPGNDFNTGDRNSERITMFNRFYIKTGITF